jgi:hypothetical protein
MDDAGVLSPDGAPSPSSPPATATAPISGCRTCHRAAEAADRRRQGARRRKACPTAISAPPGRPTANGSPSPATATPPGPATTKATAGSTPRSCHLHHPPDGTGFRKVSTRARLLPGLAQVVARRQAHRVLRDDRRGHLGRAPAQLCRQGLSQIVSVDVASGERTEHTTGTELKLQPQYISDAEIGYLIKYGPNEGLAYTSGRPPQGLPALAIVVARTASR